MPLVFFYHLYWLAAVGLATILLLAVNAYHALRHVDRTIGGEIIGIAGLALTAPAAYYVSRGTFEATALWSVAVVCALLRQQRLLCQAADQYDQPAEGSSSQAGKLALRCLPHLSAGSSFGTNVEWQLEPVRAGGIFTSDSTIVLAACEPGPTVNLRRLGWLEVIYSIVFLILTAQTFRTV
jgi:hypothetical protein